MINLFRIAPTKYSKDLSGEGSKRVGGRWNEKGSAVIYTSESRSLATLEYLANVSIDLVPADISIIHLAVPASVKLTEVDIKRLPSDWQISPAPEALAKLGSDWLRSDHSLLLKVPSAIVEEEHNFIINPSHKDFKHIEVKNTKKFSFDKRLLK